MTASQAESRTERARIEPPPVENAPADLSLLAVANVVLRRRRLVVGTAFLLVLAASVFTLLQPRLYTSSASFMPQARRSANGTGALAAQLGLSVLSNDATQSPSFYLDLLTSRNILGSTVVTTYQFSGERAGRQTTLVEFLRAKGPDSAVRSEDAVRRLRKLVKADASPKTGVVSFTVRMEDPLVARQVGDRLLELLNRFNLQTRRTQASEERQFAERRLGEVAQQLRDAEDRLQAFLQRNRAYENAPELRFAQDRLAREVAMRQQLYTALAQSYEQAKMDEVRDTPVITIIERPGLPAQPDSRRLVARIVLALLVGLALGVGIALLQELVSRERDTEASEVQEFHTLWREAVRDFAHPWKLIRRQS